MLFSAMLAGTSLACGASYQSVYEGDVHFERCYKLDSEANLESSRKLACWSRWIEHHTGGQTRDRVEYASGRERALRSGDNRAAGPVFNTSERVAGLTSTSSSGPAVMAPLPMTAFESPPITMPAPPPSAPVSADPPGLSPTQLCVRDCGQTFTGCATACKKPTCVNKCGELAKSCIGNCL